MELLEWYYSLVFESEESHAIAEVANTALEIANPPGRRSVSGRPTHQDMVDRSWATYDRIVDDAVNFVNPFRGTYAPHVGAGRGLAGTVAWFMKAGMQLSGTDDSLVKTHMPRTSRRRKE